MNIKKFIKKKISKINIILNINRDLTQLNQKKVLISYIDENFKKNFEDAIFHTQIFENNQIIKEFIDRGYHIDLINCHDSLAFNQVKNNKYDIIFGLGEFFYLMCKNNPNAKKIIYVTENHPSFSSQREQERIKYFFERHKKKVKLNRSNRYFKVEYFENIDAAIIMGEQYGFEEYQFPIHLLQPTGLRNFNFNFDKKNYTISKKNFLWFGGEGAIHKGLDILLDVFKEREDITLHICGISKKDKRILDIPSKKNIINHGKISVFSDYYLELIKQCSYIILPSCSEAHSTAVLTCMRHGLIPVVMKNSGMRDLGENNAIYLEKFNIEYVDEIITQISNKSNLEIENHEKRVFKFANQRFSIESFTLQFKQILNKLEL